MKEYRLVTNGLVYQPQKRTVWRVGRFTWRFMWTDVSCKWPSREYAQSVIDYMRKRDEEEARPWWPVGPNEHDIGYPPLPDKRGI